MNQINNNQQFRHSSIKGHPRQKKNSAQKHQNILSKKNLNSTRNMVHGGAKIRPRKNEHCEDSTISTIRGYTKLSNAVDYFGCQFKDKVVLDIGSSTGGFTEVSLNLGATKVIAIEKGTNQMYAPLRFDPRIELHEKTDIFNVAVKKPKDKTVPDCTYIEAPDIIVADVSFLSLLKVLSYAKGHLVKSSTEFIVMLKPQFEARPHQLTKGVVKNEKYRREIIKDFEQNLKNLGFIIVDKHDNDLKGRHGNRERFYRLILEK